MNIFSQTLIMRNLIVFICLLMFATASTQTIRLPQEVVQSANDRIEYGLTPSIAIGIVDANGPRYYSFGSTKEGGEKVNEHTIYEIGSISKTFTAILLAHMVEYGIVALDEPAQRFISEEEVKVPEYDGQKITMGHLSDHTSSLPRMPDNFAPADPANPYADYTVDLMNEFISGCELTRAIGSEYEYSNLAQGFLGHILAQQAGKSYEELMIEVIAEPLGMHETKVALDKNMKDNLAYGHSSGVEVSNWDIPAMAGAGGIRSSVHDMLIYLAANLGLVETDLYSSMGMTHYPRHSKANEAMVGLGWHIREGSTGDIVAHGGGTGGYSTFVGFVQETGTGVVVLTNSTEGADDIARYLLDPETELRDIKPRATTEVRKAIDENGIEEAKAFFSDLLENHKDEYDFSEQEMNTLGYTYLGGDELDKALAVFGMNILAHPEAFNVYDSYAEALMKDGQNDAAIEYYKKSLEINPGNTNGVDMLSELGVKYEAEDLKLSTEELEEYVGTYNLAPDFNIVVTLQGDQLFGQATGQDAFEMYAKEKDDFYLKDVAAQVVFSRGDDGVVESMTLFQNGQELPGKKME